MSPLLHMTTRADWTAATAAGSYRDDALTTAGFIHLSTVDQVHLPANALFAGRRDIVLLWIDPARLRAPLRWEPGVADDPDGMLFPHLYGPLDPAAVRAVTAYRPGPDGRFGRPPTPAGDCVPGS